MAMIWMIYQSSLPPMGTTTIRSIRGGGGDHGRDTGNGDGGGVEQEQDRIAVTDTASTARLVVTSSTTDPGLIGNNTIIGLNPDVTVPTPSSSSTSSSAHTKHVVEPSTDVVLDDSSSSDTIQNLPPPPRDGAVDAVVANNNGQLPIKPPKVPSDLSVEKACTVPMPADHENGDEGAVVGDDFRQRSGVFCILAGIEHTATTYVSSMIMSVPNIVGAFEGGLLVPNNTSGFTASMVEPFWYDHMVGNAKRHNVYGIVGFADWGLSVDQRDRLATAQCHAEQYVLLREYSPIFHTGNKNNINHDVQQQEEEEEEESWIIDKTPSYFRNLLSVMDRTPMVPVIVTHRSRDKLLKSFIEKHNATEHHFNVNWARYEEQLSLCQAKYPNRILVLDTTDIMHDVNGAMTKLFTFLGLRWDESYATLEGLHRKVLKVEEARSNLP